MFVPSLSRQVDRFSLKMVRKGVVRTLRRDEKEPPINEVALFNLSNGSPAKSASSLCERFPYVCLSRACLIENDDF
jgi:hypothetical protein